MSAFDGRRPMRLSGRVKILAVVALALLSVGVVAAYGALSTHDTATGTGALANETVTGDNNTADGYFALNANTTGINNTAVGVFTLDANTSGQSNTATGSTALSSNSTGGWNTATGDDALYHNTTGNNNTATGYFSLFSNTTGLNNTSAGYFSLYSNTTGYQNTGVGFYAGEGANPNVTGSDNTFLGYEAAPGTDTAIDNATAVGANAVVSQSNSLVLGALGVNVGIDNSTPASRLQIGTPSAAWGEYLQLPLVINTDKSPPASACNSTTFRGRLVLQTSGKKTVLWACTNAGVWKKI